jgi:ribosome biogenesis GTPase A
MTNFWTIVNNVIEKSDVILEVVDARLAHDSRNPEIERKVSEKRKRLIIVINKCDLIEKKEMEQLKKEIRNSVFVSSLQMLGTTILKKKILQVGNKEKIIVGVLGYPNTGKSSVINAIAGKSKARTSPQSGQTTGQQYIRVGKRILLIDTPGVIPFKEEDEFKHAVISAKDFTKVKDPEVVALDIISTLHGKIELYYGIKISDDPEEILEAIAIKCNCLRKGGIADTETTARKVIKDWQRGLIK